MKIRYNFSSMDHCPSKYTCRDDARSRLFSIYQTQWKQDLQEDCRKVCRKVALSTGRGKCNHSYTVAQGVACKAKWLQPGSLIHVSWCLTSDRLWQTSLCACLGILALSVHPEIVCQPVFTCQVLHVSVTSETEQGKSCPDFIRTQTITETLKKKEKKKCFFSPVMK